MRKDCLAIALHRFISVSSSVYIVSSEHAHFFTFLKFKFPYLNCHNYSEISDFLLFAIFLSILENNSVDLLNPTYFFQW